MQHLAGKYVFNSACTNKHTNNIGKINRGQEQTKVHGPLLKLLSGHCSHHFGLRTYASQTYPQLNSSKRPQLPLVIPAIFSSVHPIFSAHRWHPLIPKLKFLCNFCSGLTITCPSVVKAQETLHCGPGQRHRHSPGIPWTWRTYAEACCAQNHGACHAQYVQAMGTWNPCLSSHWVFCIWNLGLQES